MRVIVAMHDGPMLPNEPRAERTGDMQYALLDAGMRRRLERFGPLTIDRPAPGAAGFRVGAPATWAASDLRFDPGRPGWSGPAWPVEPWTVAIAGLTLELRATASGGVGVYPEHAATLAWLEARVRDRAADDRAATPHVLHLFAHTGLATLALARAQANVAHVDGQRAVVAWARRNAELNGLAARPIRWLVDDAAAFVAREARRGRRYDGIVLDPPAFGRAGSREWRLTEDLAPLLGACADVAAPDAFVLLTAHTEGVDADQLAGMLGSAFPSRRATVATAPMTLEADSGAELVLGSAAMLP
jgi:23S rRNA (cytosine1962-C5)-methyltransferase